MKRVLALDQGTTSSRAIIFDERGGVIGQGHYEFKQHFPRPGWVEHDAEEIWDSQWRSVEDALAAAGCGLPDVDAIGIVNQRETVVVWDRKSGKPVSPAIVWQDRRTAEYCDEHKNTDAEKLHRLTGLYLDPYFSGTKLRWILEGVPDARAKAEAGDLCFGTVESWLVWKLTGGKRHVTDVSNASRTLLMDLKTLSWDDGLLQRFEIPRAMLPEIVSNSGECARTERDLFGAEIPISGLAGDQQAALFGQLCLDQGMVKTTYGTGCFLLMQTGEEPVYSSRRLLTTVAWKLGGSPCRYALEGSVFSGGSTVQWLRDGLGLVKKSSEIDALASQVDDNGGVYLAPAFTGLGAPHWDPHARGVIAGLTRGSTAAHLARAALEGIALQVSDVAESMAADIDVPISEMRVDGGASQSDLLMQIQSDLIGCQIRRSKISETTALGAAYFAGLGTGIWSDVEQLREMWEGAETFLPSGNQKNVAAMKRGWKAVLKRSFGWAKEVGDSGGES